LCAAHKQQLFVAGSECGEIALFTPDTMFQFNKNINQPVTYVEFSFDDTRFLARAKNQLILYKIHKDEQLSIVFFGPVINTLSHKIRKASFSSDGKRVMVAMADGMLTFLNSLTGKAIEHYSAIWRCKDIANIDNQAPLALWSTKNNLLLLLDPAEHIDKTIYTFMVRKSSNGRFLTMCKFFPNNPKAMGLTKDENTVVFVHKDNKVSCIHLYDNPYLQYIDFIENKANIYHLCELLQICKNIKVDQHNNATRDLNATQFINTICSCIKSYHDIKL
jgi:WD40 repeat protein